MIIKTEELDVYSGYFFTAGFFISRARVLPLALLNSILNLVSLLSYLVGYALWLVATLSYPNYPRKREAWYGFAEFKDQFQVAAILGTVATVICLTYPPFLLLAFWLFATSNFLWTVGEYHKKENPPANNKNFSTLRQETYLKYAYLMTTISVLTAVTSTAMIYYPPISTAVSLFSGVAGNALTFLAFYYWRQSAYGEHPPDAKLNHSYNLYSQTLGSSLEEKPTLNNEEKIEVPHYHSPLHTSQPPIPVQNHTNTSHNEPNP